MAERAKPGARVRVRFRGRKMVGLVAEVSDRCTLPRVLDVDEFPDEPGRAKGDADALLSPELMSLARWVSRYYGCSLGESAAAMVPRGVRSRGKSAVRRRVRLAKPAADATREADGLLTERNAQARILRALAKAPDGLLLADLLRRTKASQSPIRTLE